MASRIAFRDVPVGRLLTQLAESIPDNEALVYSHRELRFTFADLEREARLIARGLIGAGVGQGDRVAVWATNVPEWIVLQFALAKVGAILVTVNTSLRAREVEYLLRQSESTTLFTIAGFKSVDYVAELREAGAAGVQRVFFIGENCPPDLTPYAQLRTLAAAVSDAALDAREALVGVDDVINMQYTSGTTGFPKGVMLSSRNIVNNGYWIGVGLGYSPADRLCLCVPLFHCFGCVLGVLAAYTHGACLCAVEFFDPLSVLETVDREKCTALYGVPTMFLAELEHPEFGRFDTSSLRTGIMAGALCPEPLMRRVIDQMKMRELTIVYGLTETSPGLTQTPRDADLVERTQTVGRVMPETEVRIVDPATGADVAIGADGELWARGYVVMKGYYKMPEATAATITDDGWLKSGDQASIDAEGRVRITGRIKDIIIRGGENIAPKEVEDVLRTHPAIADASVYAVKSEFFGEEVAAALRLHPNVTVDIADVQSFCLDRIARFKVPRHIRIVDAFPLTASGKIQKFRLREAHEAARLPASE
ncbi:MAG TPA: AMP-binding protein [Vicinamibacterales bacterium]|nr:AMP-binding protein [Vicinamibacterales bacterium]